MTADAQQAHVLKSFAELHQYLTRKSNWPFIRKYKPIKGIYLWGNVGRGKTFLMDLFFNTLQTKRKLRLHFQRFMKNIHNDLFKLAGQPEPLKQIANQLAREVDIICLDEFYIDDIADAMLIGGLLKSLYEKGIILVMTSNLMPDELYLNGTNRERFLPAIEEIKSNSHLICLDGEKDYRLSSKPGNHFFFGPDTDSQLHAYYHNLPTLQSKGPSTLDINHRTVNFKRKNDGIIWFDFNELCEKPRSQHDYIYIAQHFHTLFISHIPQLDDGQSEENKNHDRARRFISLIDELYDRSVNLIAGFDVELNQLYLGKKLHFQFNRTYSRLVEMQTHEYILRPHRT